MCMHKKLTVTEKKEWLKDKPSILTLYKVVRTHMPAEPIEKDIYYPPFYYESATYKKERFYPLLTDQYLDLGIKCYMMRKLGKKLT